MNAEIEKQNQPDKAKLAQKIAKITAEIGSVEKDGKNQHSNYSYISYEQLNARLPPLLLKHGIAIINDVESYNETEYQTRKGTGTRTIVTMNFEIIDTDTGFSKTVSAIGSDQDTGGKSMSQAITECCKRFLLKQFMISSKDDIDSDSRSLFIETDMPADAMADNAVIYPASHQTFRDIMNTKDNEFRKNVRNYISENIKKEFENLTSEELVQVAKHFNITEQ